MPEALGGRPVRAQSNRNCGPMALATMSLNQLLEELRFVLSPFGFVDHRMVLASPLNETFDWSASGDLLIFKEQCDSVIDAKS